MPRHVIIDGNNLLYAMHAHAPIPSVGRETMVKVIERWARRGQDEVTLVFDGPPPIGGLTKQMASSRIAVRFSAPKSADDIIVSLIHRAKDPGSVRAVSSDTAIRHEAHLRRSVCTDSVAFIAELFSNAAPPPEPGESAADDKPTVGIPTDTDAWLDEFGIDIDDEPFDGFDAMKD